MPGPSGGQAGGPLHSEILLAALRLLRETVDHEVPILDFMSAFALEFQKQIDRRNLFHFTMRLRPEFEALHGNILYHHPLPTLTESVVEFTV